MKQPIIDFFRTYKGVLLFFISMFAADIVWKLCISGDEQSATIFFLKRYDWSEAFAFISTIIAKVTYFFTSIFDSSAILRENIISFPDSKGIMIVWSCSGIKQMFIFLIIMIFADGRWKNKLWFIPIGLLMCFFINILRTTTLALIIKDHREIFPFMHHYVLKYLYYCLIFIIWLLWEERLKNFSHTKH